MSTSVHASRPTRTGVRMVLTRRGRIVVVSLIVIFLLAIAFGAYFIATPQASAGTESALSYRSIAVQEGQSLWSIAREHAPEGVDIRDYILELQEANGLEGSLLRDGQSILVPVHE